MRVFPGLYGYTHIKKTSLNELLQKCKTVTIHQKNLHIIATKIFKIEIMTKVFSFISTYI